MGEKLEKLRPDRDLQCYFHRPTAVAALHHASPYGFMVTGTWRQQFDWVVIEWNRDNVLEHPSFRYLPDGDLSGLTLSYEERRENCIPMDSSLFPVVDWPYLRIWADDGTREEVYRVRLRDYATFVEGGYEPATAELVLAGDPTPGDYVGISCLDEHHTYQLYGSDTLEGAVQAIVDSVNAFSKYLVAARQGTKLILRYVGPGRSLSTGSGAEGNRVGVYGFVAGAGTEYWVPWWTKFSGGRSPTKWRVTLPFGDLVDIEGRRVPTERVRKMRWTYAADLQDGAFERTEFLVEVTNWQVTGSGREYNVAGPGSWRIEDNASEVEYAGAWSSHAGNFSGGSIRLSTEPGARVRCHYRASARHRLYLGTRATFNGGSVRVVIDGVERGTENLLIPGEDVLQRRLLGEFEGGEHLVELIHVGLPGTHFYFDFLEIAYPTSELPVYPVHSRVALATDWDTDHSMAVAAERTAWMIYTSGLHGRVNHYVGALWFYELACKGYQYASAVVEFVGQPEFSQITELRIGYVNEPPEADTVIAHVNRIGDTAETIAKAFELELNRGYTAVWARAEGNRLTIFARAMGEEGNRIRITASPQTGNFFVRVSGPTLAGGVDGEWVTDTTAKPRLNRAARDWSAAYYRALKSYGLDVVAAFSMELQHADPSPEAGLAQRYPNGEPVRLSTPAIQTNFSPASREFWKEVYLEMAGILAEAGHRPYLQFGEVQWWYFPLAGSGMPFYDDYTRSAFEATYGRPMALIHSNEVDPSQHPEEAEFLARLLAEFTLDVIAHVRQVYPGARFEILYPVDVNQPAFNRVVNFPSWAWTADRFDCLKTESFTYTFNRNLDAAKRAVEFGLEAGFEPAKRSHLVGVADPASPWLKEARWALSWGFESTVLFALDQFCLVGYPLPLPLGQRRAAYLGR